MTRWTIAALAALLAACNNSTSAPKVDPLVERVDHLMFAVADLNDGIAQIEALTGVRAQLGGAHPGRGSHNALLSLGPRDWGATEHPAASSPKGVQLVSLRTRHPASRSLQPIYDALGIALQIEAGSEPAMIAVLDTPRGRVELR